MLQIADEWLLNVNSTPIVGCYRTNGGTIDLAWGLKLKAFDFANTLSIDCSNLKPFQVVLTVVSCIGICNRANLSLGLPWP